MPNRYMSLVRPVDGPLLPEHFTISHRAQPELAEGEVLLRMVAISVDPYLRALMTGTATWGLEPFAPGQPIRSTGVGRIEASRNPDFAEGILVQGILEWADTTLWKAGNDPFGPGMLEPLDPAITKPTHALGVLGTGGLTAYYGILDVARPQAGETILISGAAGGVGSLAGQVARQLGARVIGLAGTDEKCALLTDRLGFDAAVNYKAADLEDRLRALMPSGPDIYFDNVGGELSQRVMWMMRRRARVIECGQIATYDKAGGYKIDLSPIHANCLRLESFSTPPYDHLLPAAIAQLSRWMDEGKLIVLETERHGLESLPGAMCGIMRGENVGKMVVSA